MQRHRYHSIASRASHSGRPIGLQPSRNSAARRWDGVAPQLSLRNLPRFHRHHFQRPRRLRRQLRRRLSLPQHPAGQWIPSTVQLIPRTLGLPIRKRGAAESTTAVALQPQRRSPLSCQPHNRSHQPILSIALMASRIGKQVGQCPRRSGAAESTARVVRIKAVAALRLPSRTIAMLDSQIGWQVGPWRRRLGVAAMKARAAHQQQVGVLRSRNGMSARRVRLKVAALAFVPSSGAWRQRSARIGS